MISASKLIADCFSEALQPDPEITVSEWSDEFRVLAGVAASEPGPWRTSRTPYLREPMDNLSATSPIQRQILMWGAQLGKTEGGNNWTGYVIHKCPAPMLYVLPTVEVARRTSRQRIGPMIQSTPALRSLIGDGRARSKDASDTAFMKDFPGGTLIFTGSNSASGLRSMPIRFLYMDEVDEFEEDVGNQGDPVALAEERLQTYGTRAKTLLTSTPTVKDFSRIEKEFNRTDKRRFYIPCPFCGHFDFLTWSGEDRVTRVPGTHHRIGWVDGKPEDAHMVCGACQEVVPESFKPAMLAAGEWRPTAVGEHNTRGYHLSGLYSPWRFWSYCVRRFLRVKNDRFEFKTFVNTVWAETWEEAGVSIDAHALLIPSRKDPRLPESADVPTGVGMLACAVDTQDDRLEALVLGYGEGEEVWPIAWHQFYGDPGHDQVWLDLDRLLIREFRHESGQPMRIEMTTVDSGGHHSDRVYRFCKARETRIVYGVEAKTFAVKGGSEFGKPVVGMPSRNNRYRAKLFVLCTTTAKEILMSRLVLPDRGAGFVHIPDWADLEFVEQMTAEKGLRKWIPGRGSFVVFEKIRERNEVLDLMVYGLAGIRIATAGQPGVLAERAARFAVRVDPTQPPPSGAPVQMPRRLSGWVRRYRR